MFLLNQINANYYKYQAEKAYRKKDWQQCIYQFSGTLKHKATLTAFQADMFNDAKKQLQLENFNKGKKIAVCGWDLSHNAAGRVLTLAELYQHCGYDISIIGCVISSNPKRPKQLWEPMQLSDILCSFITVKDTSELIYKAFDFVRSHPFDIVHLSKPRLPNLIIGRLYQLIWNTHIIMDVDDEELGFGQFDKGLLPNNTDITSIRSDYWLNKSVSLANTFDAITVSNAALQFRYSGTVIPHVRDANKFLPSKQLTLEMRKKYDVPPAQKVLLFFGTPKPHKGIIETAQALSRIKENDFLFLIIGDFISKAFQDKLTAIKGVNFKFLPNQPYHSISKFVSMGDVCVILQDTDSIISEFQLPAKLIDALAMGLTVVSTVTPALNSLIEAGVIIPTNKEQLPSTLIQIFSEPSRSAFNRDYFLQNLSTQVFVPVLTGLLKELRSQNHPIYSNKCYDIITLTEYHSSP